MLRASIALGAALAACGGDGACDPEARNTICTIAGSGEQGFGGDGGPATAAMLYIPMDAAISPDGEVWVLDFNNYVVRAIDAKGNIRTVVGSGMIGDSPPPDVPSIPALDATLNHTSRLLFHDGYLYLAAWHNSRIKRVRLSDMMLENYAGRGRRTYYDGDEGPALLASLDLPSSMAFDPAGGLAIMDQGNQVVRRIDPGGTIHRIAGACIVDEGCAPGEQPVACSGSPKFPGSNKLACGNLDLQCAAPCTPRYAGDGGPPLEAMLNRPYGIDLVGKRLYVTDSYNNRIRVVNLP